LETFHSKIGSIPEVLGGERKMKKFLLIALAVAAFGFASAPSSEAGVVVSFGFGGYPYYPYYGHGYGYPYYGYYGPSVYVGPSFYWYHGHRYYYPRRYHHRYYRHWR
jgi:hypothetical protein